MPLHHSKGLSHSDSSHFLLLSVCTGGGASVPLKDPVKILKGVEAATESNLLYRNFTLPQKELGPLYPAFIYIIYKVYFTQLIKQAA